VSSHSHDPNPIRPISDRSTPVDPAADRRSEASSSGASAARTRAPSPGIDQVREVVGHAIGVVRARRKLFRGVFLGVAALLTATILLQTPLYESTSLMLVKFGRELVYRPEIGTDRSFVSPDKAAVINSELAILRSRPVLEGVVREIGVPVLYPSMADDYAEAVKLRSESGDESSAETLMIAEAAERLRLALTSQALPEADVIQVSIQHPDPIVAADAVNQLVEQFLDAHLSAFAQPEVVQFLEGRVSSFEDRLAESEQALRNFQSEHSAFALEDPYAVLIQQREQTRLLLNEIDNQKAAIRLRHMQEDASVGQARNQLLNLEVEASRREGRLLQETRAQIEVVKKFIAQRKAEVNGELQSLEAHRKVVEQELAEIELELKEMPALTSAYRGLASERDGDEEQYRTYRKRLHEARISSEMDRERIASINVIQRATPTPRPVWPPSKPVGVAVALVLALIAAVLTVIGLDRIGPVGVAWLDEQDDQRAAG
jgi:uncharacterized protein involved in exopolysaccharide biosynthesis